MAMYSTLDSYIMVQAKRDIDNIAVSYCFCDEQSCLKVIEFYVHVSAIGL